MKLHIRHCTTYRYDTPADYAAQILRVTPRACDVLNVVSWRVSTEFGGRMQSFTDGFQNLCHLLTVARRHDQLRVSVEGVVETFDTQGLVRGVEEPFAPSMFLRATPLTAPSDGIRALAREAATNAADVPALLDRLLRLTRERIEYRPGTTHVGTTAAEALASGAGVCQDHAHVFIASARSLGVPARYIGGYLCLEENEEEQQAGHAWVEAYDPARGWVALDPANGVSPGERYVRTSVGLDYTSAAPVRGVRRGKGCATLQVGVQVARVVGQ